VFIPIIAPVVLHQRFEWLKFVIVVAQAGDLAPGQNKKHRLLAGFGGEEIFVFDEFKPESYEAMLDAVGQVVGTMEAPAFHKVGDIVDQIIINLLETHWASPRGGIGRYSWKRSDLGTNGRVRHEITPLLRLDTPAR